MENRKRKKYTNTASLLAECMHKHQRIFWKNLSCCYSICYPTIGGGYMNITIGSYLCCTTCFCTHSRIYLIQQIQIYLWYSGPIWLGPICWGPICQTNIFQGPNLPKMGKLGPKMCGAQFATKSAWGPIWLEPVIFVYFQRTSNLLN